MVDASSARWLTTGRVNLISARGNLTSASVAPVAAIAIFCSSSEKYSSRSPEDSDQEGPNDDSCGEA